MKKFQDQSLFINMLRYLWYLTVPYIAINIWLSTAKEQLTFGVCWGIAIGIVQSNMKRAPTVEELFAAIDKEEKDL